MNKLQNILNNLMGVWYEKEPTIIEKPLESSSAVPKALNNYINQYGESVQEFDDDYEGERFKFQH